MLCYIILYHVFLLGTAVIRLRRGGGRGFSGKGGKGSLWLGRPFFF
jgi:hypothetical protein